MDEMWLNFLRDDQDSLPKDVTSENLYPRYPDYVEVKLSDLREKEE